MLNQFFFFIADIIEVIVVWLIALAIRIFEWIMTIPASIWKLRFLKKEGPKIRLKKAKRTLYVIKKIPRSALLFFDPLTLISIVTRTTKLLPRRLGFHWAAETAAYLATSWFIFLIYIQGHDAVKYLIWGSHSVPQSIVRRQAIAVEIFPYRSMEHEPDYDMDIRELVPLNEALSFFSDYIFTTFLYYAGYFTIGVYILDWQKALKLAVDDNKYISSGPTSLIFELPILLLPRSDLFYTLGGPTALRFFKRKWWRIGPWKRKRYIKSIYRKRSVVWFLVMYNISWDTLESSIKAFHWYLWPKLDYLADPEIWSLELTSGAFPLF